MNSSELASWSQAAGTFLAVIVALFGDSIVRLWRKPELNALIRSEGRDHSIEGQGAYLRLWVENLGSTAAENVEVFLDSVEELRADGSQRPLTNFLSMNLRWAHDSPENPLIFMNVISPGIGKLCNIGGVCENCRTTFTLWTQVGPLSGSHQLTPGSYVLHLKVVAANSRPVQRDFLLTFQGKWSSDRTEMFTKSIGISNWRKKR